MKGKVNCTCGWSWNKSDSSKKDMYICHECGRDNSNNMKNGGWLDNYGEEDNYNDSQVSAPEGMVGDGFSNVGRNYSPAWGGQFQLGGSVYPVNYVPEAQMGASIPGAVGFSYARTQSPAPSNGKYAKKTMASAQDGGWLDGYDVAQDGVQTWKKQQALVKKEKLEKLDKLLKNPPVFKKKTFEEKVKENLKEKREVVKESTAVRNYNNADKFSKAARNKTDKEIADERKAIRKKADANVLNQYSTKLFDTDNLTRQNLSDASLGLESKFRVSDEPNFFDDYLNPANMIGNMASNLGQAPLQAQQTDSYMPYVTAIGMPLVAGALGGLGANSNAQFVNNLVNPIAGLEVNALRTLPKAKSIKDALGTLKGIPTERSLPRLSPEELKVFRQVQEVGRMRATNKSISEQYRYALDQNIPDEHFEKVFGRSKSEVEQILPSIAEQEAIRSSIPIRERFNLERTPRRSSSSDAAIDQMNRDETIRRGLTDYGSDADIERLLERTYNPSELRPIPEELIINTRPNRGRTIINQQNPRLSLKETAIDDWERYVDNKVPTSEVINNKFANIVSEYPYYKGPVLENVPSLSLSTSGNLKNVSKKVENQSVLGISSGDVFTGSLNTSHNSYLPQIKQVFKYTDGSPQFLGYKPMNHLGFLSDFRYSQDDIAKYLNTEIDQQISRGVIPKDVLRPYVTNKDRVILPHYGIKQFEEGGIIKDDRGQWDHPGEITEIGSNQITMQGVPYPVLGISDTGDTKLMKPGKDYKFKGKKVTEFPMAQTGKKVSGGLGVEDWWNNREEIQSTYRMANDVDPFMKNWMNNPITQKRLNDQIGYLMDDNKKPINVINENLNTLLVYDQKKMEGKKTSDFISNYKLQNDLGSEYPDSQFERSFNGLREKLDIVGSYAPNIHSMSVKDMNDKGTLAHEMTHSSGIQDKMEHYMEYNYNQKPDPNYPEDSYIRNQYDYLKKDGMYPRIMDIRRELNLKPGQKVDKRIFNGNNKKTDSAILDLQEMYEDDEIIKILNTIADNSNTKKLSTAKNGLRQEQKGLQNLNNLVNFTNYNTKQPGGWLDTL